MTEGNYFEMNWSTQRSYGDPLFRVNEWMICEEHDQDEDHRWTWTWAINLITGEIVRVPTNHYRHWESTREFVTKWLALGRPDVQDLIEPNVMPNGFKYWLRSYLTVDDLDAAA